MDAEVWSHADIRNGRWLFFVLSALILAEQIVAIACAVLGVPLAPLEGGAGLGGSLPDVVRFAATFMFTVGLIVLAASGRGWARYSFSAVAALMAGVTLARSLPGLPLALHDPNARPLGQAILVLAGLAAVAVAASLALIVLPPLRAYAWYRATKRSAIPVPNDDEPAGRRSLRRAPTVGERLAAVARAVGTTVLVAVILVVWGYVAGVGQWLDFVP